MKIMYFIDTYPTNGGAPISSCLLANHLSERYEMELVMPQNNRKDSVCQNVKCIEIPGFQDTFPFWLSEPIKNMHFIQKINKAIKSEKPDIIHAQMPRSGLALGVLKRFHQIDPSIRLIYTDREQVGQLKKMYKIIFSALIGKCFDEVVSLTETGTLYWKEHMAMENVRVIGNSAGSLYDIYDDSLHSIIRKNYRIPADKICIMFAGRMHPSKNWDLAADVIKGLGSDANLFFVLAVSSGNPEQDAQTDELQKKIKEATDNFIVLRNIDQKNISSLYYAADVFALTSKREAFGRTAIEAMSRKCAVIGTNVGGIPDVIGKKDNLFEEDSTQFIHKILYYKENRAELEKDKAWFYERYITNYDLSTVLDKHERLYETFRNVSFT